MGEADAEKGGMPPGKEADTRGYCAAASVEKPCRCLCFGCRLHITYNRFLLRTK